MDTSEGEIERLIVEALSSIASGHATVLIGSAVSPLLIRKILENPVVFGIIRVEISAGDPWGGVIFVDRNGGREVVPPSLPKLLLVVSRERLGIRAAVSLVRRGVRGLVMINPLGREHQQQSLSKHLFWDTIAAIRRYVVPDDAVRNGWVVRRIAEGLDGRVTRKLSCLPKLQIEHSRGSGPIVLASGSLGPGGSERQLMLAAIGLQKRLKNEVQILCQSKLRGSGEFFLERIGAHGVVVKDDIVTKAYAFPLSERMEVAAEIDRLGLTGSSLGHLVGGFMLEFRKSRPEVVHAWLDEPNISAGMAAALCGVPKIILGCRSVAPQHFKFYRTYMRSAYRAHLSLPNVTMVNTSHAGAESYASWLGIPRKSITVIPNGFDSSSMRDVERRDVAALRTQLGIDAAPIIGMVGRFAEEKRPFLWLDSARSVMEKNSKVNFLWVGDGPLRQAARDYAAKIGIGGRFFTPGLVEDVSSALAAMDVFLLTSRVEGLPNVIIEAQFYGVAVVTADVGGAKEALTDGLAGISIAGSDPRRFADAILSFLKKPEVIAKLGGKSRGIVGESFSTKSMIESIVSVYSLGK
ncbi:MAG: glycosyltransferase [Alphaproteobacteria bacterium]